MHDPGSPGIGFIPSQADRSAPVSGAGQLPRYLRGGYRDATPLLTGVPRPSSGPRHSAEPAPQRRTLAARYRSADPIDLDGATVYPMYSEQLPTPASALTMTLLSATPPAGLAAVGIGLSVIDGYIDLDDRHLAGVDIWRDALERGITFDLAADSPDALFALTPVWSNAAGEPQSWSGNYGIVVERTEMGRTVLWCSMGEGPPHFADLVIEVRSTPLDPHPHLFTSGTIPTISTPTPSQRRGNRHHWVEPDEPAPDDALELDPWTAHYERAVDDSPETPHLDEPAAEPTAIESRTPPVADDSTSAPVTDDPVTASATRESAPVAQEPATVSTTRESVHTPIAYESAPVGTATGDLPGPTAPAYTFTTATTVSPPTAAADLLPAPSMPTPTTYTFTGEPTGYDSPQTLTTAHAATSPTPGETAPAPVAHEPALAPTAAGALSVPTIRPPTTYTFTSESPDYDSPPALTTADSATSPTTGEPPAHELAPDPIPAEVRPVCTAVATTMPTDHGFLAVTTRGAQSATTTHKSPPATNSGDDATAPATAGHPAESRESGTAMAAAAPDSVPKSAGDDAEIQGYPCSFADIQLSAPAYEEASDDSGALEATAPHRVLVDDFAGYDDPLTRTGADRRVPDDTAGESYPDIGRHGWAESPELTGLVPVIRDAGFTDYGPEPPRPAATDSAATTSRYRTPLLAGDAAAPEFTTRDDRSLVDTLADDSLAPVRPVDQLPVDDEVDPARLHSLGAVAHAQGDDDRAHLLWTRAARAGYLGAIYDLGALSLRRDDPGAAERWWRAAAGRRMIPAMAELATLLEQRGALAEARMWRTQAVAEEVIATATRRPAGGETFTGMR
ncbi:hypothetical protein [Nocardia carnea]|uniref:hypothetical protein n=1 Tax=Nocardia carnea TaxID=37328 RepID=UPI0024543977|nr:hypothetical protein [Nocardia carnea]